MGNETSTMMQQSKIQFKLNILMLIFWGWGFVMKNYVIRCENAKFHTL